MSIASAFGSSIDEGEASITTSYTGSISVFNKPDIMTMYRPDLSTTPGIPLNPRFSFDSTGLRPSPSSSSSSTSFASSSMVADGAHPMSQQRQLAMAANNVSSSSSSSYPFSINPARGLAGTPAFHPHNGMLLQSSHNNGGDGGTLPSLKRALTVEQRQAICRAVKARAFLPTLPPLSPQESVGQSDLTSEMFGSRAGATTYPHPDLTAVRVPSATFHALPPPPDILLRTQGSTPISSMLQEGERRKKTLEDLERELLSDDIADISQTSGPTPAMAIESDWVDVMEELLHVTSPRPSSLLIPNPASSSVNQVVSCCSASDRSFTQQESPTAGHQITSGQLNGSRIGQLLASCARVMADNNNSLDLAMVHITRLKQIASIHGEPMKRLAFYMVEALEARAEQFSSSSSSSSTSSSASSSSPGLPGRPTFSSSSSPTASMEIFKGMQILYEVCPYFKFAYMAANGAILEALKGESKVHIVDFKIGHGGKQWISLINALAAGPGAPPEVRLTAIEEPQPNPALAEERLKHMAKTLGDVAKSRGVPFEFNLISAKVGEVESHMLETRAGEALAVSLVFQLHCVADESVCTSNPRDRLLRTVRAAGPKVVVLVEHEANTNTAPFLPRFLEALGYYAAMFESLDVALARESHERVGIERDCLARNILNIVACEGAERVKRCEPAGKWRARMSMAGFRPSPLTLHSNNLNTLLQSYGNNTNYYRMKESGGALHLGWLERVLIVASAWH